MQFTRQDDGIVHSLRASVFYLPFFCNLWIANPDLFIPGLLAEHPQVSAQEPERDLGIRNRESIAGKRTVPG